MQPYNASKIRKEQEILYEKIGKTMVDYLLSITHLSEQDILDEPTRKTAYDYAERSFFINGTPPLWLESPLAAKYALAVSTFETEDIADFAANPTGWPERMAKKHSNEMFPDKSSGYKNHRELAVEYLIRQYLNLFETTACWEHEHQRLRDLVENRHNVHATFELGGQQVEGTVGSNWLRFDFLDPSLDFRKLNEQKAAQKLLTDNGYASDSNLYFGCLKFVTSYRKVIWKNPYFTGKNEAPQNSYDTIFSVT